MTDNLKHVAVGDTRLAYLQRGRGAPVVLLHGGGATDYRTWGGQIEPLAARYRVIAYSRRYHYPNAWPDDGAAVNDLAAHAADLSALITTLDLGRVHLVGFSFGADVALRFAAEYPQQLRALILVEPGLFSWLAALPGGAALFAAFAAALRPAREAVRAGDVATGMRLWLDSFMGQGALDRLPAAAVGRIRDNARLIGFEPATLADIAGEITHEEAAAIRAPSLLLSGDASAAMFHLVMDELAGRLPHARRVTIPQADHLLHLMNPEAFNAALLHFLDGR
jgi:pimeloyl-ACP methyl ester carboxylesterase